MPSNFCKPGLIVHHGPAVRRKWRSSGRSEGRVLSVTWASKKGLVLLVFALVALLASSCAGRADFASEDQPTGDEQSPPTDSVALDGADVGTIDATGNEDGAAASDRPAVVLPTDDVPDLDFDLNYQIEADSINGWAPDTVVPTVSGHLILRSVYDLLIYPNATREPSPMLLESFVPNGDASVWTLTTRSGIRFHDGTPFDAEAVVVNLERHRDAVMTAAFLSDVDSIEATAPDEVTVTLAGPRPHFPERLTTTIGYMASPTWLAAVDAGTASIEAPVGTGPFVFDEYRPGKSFRAVRNDDYWQADRPLLGSILFQVIANSQSRYQSVTQAIAPVSYANSPDFIRRARGAIGQIKIVESAANSETTYVMLNQADPDSPLRDLAVRTAMSQAVNRESWRVARGGSFFEAANGPFSPGSIGHLVDSGTPGHDPAAAAAAITEYESENGQIEIGLLLEDTATSVLSSDLLVGAWAEIGIDVTPEFLPMDELMNRALDGRFDLLLTQNHGSYDPVLQANFWHSSAARPVGEPTSNFSRIADESIDSDLALLETTEHPGARQLAAERINRRFAEQSYNIWLSWPVWAVIHSPDMHFAGSTLPSGEPAMPMGGAVGGAHLLSHLWVEER